MEIILFSSSNSFNAIFTIYTYLTVMSLPIFAAYGLFSGR